MRGVSIKYLTWIMTGSCAVFLFANIYSPRLGKVCGLIAAGAFILLRLAEKKRPFFKNFLEYTPLNKAIGCFLLVAVLSTIFAVSPYESQKILFNRYVIYFTIFFVGAFLGKEAFRVKIIILALLAGAVVVGIGGLVDIVSAGRISRLHTSFGSGIYGTYFLFTLPFFISFIIFHSSKKIKFLCLLLALPVFAAFILHGSRGVWLGLISALLIVGLLVTKKKFYLLSLTLALIALIFSVPLRGGILSDGGLEDPNIKARLYMWKAAININKESPLLGAGPGSYGDLMYDFYPAEAEGVIRHLHAHSTYFEVLAEMGILGLLSLLWILVLFFHTGYKALKKTANAYNASFMMMFLALIVSEFFMSVILVGLVGSAVFWLLLGVGMQIFGPKTRQRSENAA